MGTSNQIAVALQELAALHATELSVLGAAVTGTGGSVPGSGADFTAVETFRRPWLDPPPGFESFDFQSGIALPAVGAGYTSVLSILIPNGSDGVINGINWNYVGSGFVDFSGDLSAQIWRNGTPVRGFDAMLNQKGSINIPRVISPIRVYAGQTIQLVINHVANALLTGNIVAGFQGYYYPNQG